jgi:hypothetical protein
MKSVKRLMEGDMDGVQIFAFLVRCSANLLICQEVDTESLRFHDIEDCRTRLPAIVHTIGERTERTRVVMGKCRFVLKKRPEPVSRRHRPATS